jgi:hypothetical protein
MTLEIEGRQARVLPNNRLLAFKRLLDRYTFESDSVGLSPCQKHGARANVRDCAALHGLGSLLRHWSAVLLALALPVSAISDVQTTTQSVSASVSPYGKVSVPSSIGLQALNTRFGNLAGTVAASYWVRTSDAGGGSLTVQANSEFSPAGGPTISSVTYTCSGATLGAGCSGIQTLATSTQTPIVNLPSGVCTGGGGSCSTQEPNTVLLTFTAPNKPQFKTGTYSAQIIFTISTI